MFNKILAQKIKFNNIYVKNASESTRVYPGNARFVQHVNIIQYKSTILME